MKKYIYFPFFLLFLSCNGLWLPEAEENTVLNNFDVLCDDFRTHYGLFGPKNVHWDSLCASNRAILAQKPSDSALYFALKQVLRPLNDPHVFLVPQPSSFPRFESSLFFDTAKVQRDFRPQVVDSLYLKEKFVLNSQIMYGKINDSIGYIRLSDFGGSVGAFEKRLEEALNALASTQGLVLDLRYHGGGDDRIGQMVAGHFCSEKALYMTTRKRNGPAPEDFTAPMSWYVAPTTTARYLKPVVMLTSRFTQSAGETFVLAMRSQPSITHAGDTTGGGLSDMAARELPNGWIYFMSIGDYRAANGQSFEGLGIPPTVFMRSTEAALDTGHDSALEYAIEQLR